jgi:RimJ/RimL family protein N-acetyltransferase
MNEAEYADFAMMSAPGYAKDQVEARVWAPDKALQLATEDFKRLLPQGMGTPDHYFYMLRDGASASSVGILWFARKERAGRKVAYVYSVFIREEFRRMGYATQALKALEGEAHSMGLAGIELHVFGWNAKARALYQKIGFHETNITMFKPVGVPSS